jgi:hypothetical protein
MCVGTLVAVDKLLRLVKINQGSFLDLFCSKSIGIERIKY